MKSSIMLDHWSEDSRLQQIADMLVLNGTLVDCPGLIYGKMGIAIFFFHYAQHANNELYADYAMDLISGIQDQIHDNSPANYATGLAGIAIGIDYLVFNHLLDADEDLFEDFDKRMYRAVMYDPWPDMSQYGGLTGYGRYWLMRARQQVLSKQARECLSLIAERIKDELFEIPTKDRVDVYCFIQDLQKIPGSHRCVELLELSQTWNLQLQEINRCFVRLGDSVIGNRIRTFLHDHYFESTLKDTLDTASKPQLSYSETEERPVNTGLLSGYAGEGMLLLEALHPISRSWMYLL